MPRCLRFLVFLAVVGAVTGRPALAGPNAGGVLVITASESLVYTSGADFCQQAAATNCANIDTEVPDDVTVVAHVMAAFHPGSAPRVSEVVFGVNYDPLLTVLDWLGCGNGEVADPTWPASGSGVRVLLDPNDSSAFLEVGWFAIEAPPGAGLFQLAPHPIDGAIFLDDSLPAEQDPIADLGALGFGMPGSSSCPGQGACCLPNGTCRLDLQPDCEADGGAFQGDGTTCSPDPCPPPTGACCDQLGVCQVTVEIDCGKGGAWQGPGTLCLPNPCPAPTGACCFVLQACQILTESDCNSQSGTYQGDLTGCTPDPCPQPQCDVSPPSIDFGLIGVGAFADEAFTLTNLGGALLQGTVTEACVDFAVLGDPTYFLLPLEQKIFTVRFSPVAGGAASCDLDLGPECGILPLLGEGNPLPMCLVETPDPGAPLSLLFGDVGVGQSRDLTFGITNGGGGQLTGLVTEACDGFSIIGEAAYDLGPGGSATITVRFSPVAEQAYGCAIETGAECANLIAIGDGVPPPICVVDPINLDFGPVGIGQTADRIFRITNTGVGDLAGAVSESCPQFSIVGVAAYDLAAGESQDFRVRYAPTSTGSASCSIFAGLGCSNVEAEGFGETAPDCVVTPPTLDFGVVTLGEFVDLTFEVRNIGGGVVAGTVTESCPAYSILGSTGYSLASGEFKVFTLRFTPDSEGRVDCIVETNCGDIAATGVGAAAPACLFTPTAILFGDVAVGDIAERGLTLTNTGGQTLEGTLGSPCPDFVIVGAAAYALAHGEAKDFVVRFTPTTTGPAVCTLESGNQYCEGPPVSGRGIPGASCVVDPGSLNFGDVFVGESADRTLSITNVGGGTLTGSISSPCGDFMVVGDPSYSLGAGVAKEFILRFTPGAPAPSSCDLDPGSICPSVSLDGNGISPPTCLLEPTDIDFGVLGIGKSAVQEFTLTNVGEGQLEGAVSAGCDQFSVARRDGGELSYDLGSGDSAVFVVEFAPTGEGPISCEVTTGISCPPLTAQGSGVLEPRCVVEPDTLDFDIVPVGEFASRTLLVGNDGGGVLIGAVTPLCPEIEIEGGDYLLAAGEQQQVVVRFTPSNTGPFQCEVSTGNTCDPVLAVGVGDPLPSCSLSAESIDLGVTIPGKPLSTSFTVTNTGGGLLAGVVRSKCPEFTIEGAGAYELGGDESVEFRVVFLAQSVGPASCALDVGSDCPPLVVNALVEPGPQCTIREASLDFGEVPVGSSADRRFTVTNEGGGVLVGAVSSPCSPFTVVGDPSFQLGRGGEKEFTIRFRPAQEGNFVCSIAAGSSCVEVNVSGLARAADGACCFPDGSCQIGRESDCQVAGGTYFGDGTACDDASCVSRAACCTRGSCELATESDCLAAGGEWTAGADCNGVACVSSGACCYLDGSCRILTVEECTASGGNYQGDASTCAAVHCVALGACCFGNGDCDVLTEVDCLDGGGRLWSIGVLCEDAECRAVGACCTPAGDCLLVTEANCADGDYQGDGTTCGLRTCAAAGACCEAIGTCVVVSESQCAGLFLGRDTSCTPELCVDKVSDVTVVPASDTARFQVTTRGTAVQNLEGWYRVAGTLDYQQIPSFAREGDVWTGEFGLTDYTIRGLEYYLAYFDSGIGLLVSHGDAAEPHRMAVRAAATLPSLAPYRYRMMAAPLQIDDPAATYQLFRERLGEPGSASWRMGWWDPGAAHYVLVDSGHSNGFRNGQAYWLAFASPQDPWSLEGVSTLPPEGATAFTRILQPGWNMVGNPAAYPISVAPEYLWIDDAGARLRFDQARAESTPRVSEIYLYDSSLPANAEFYPYQVRPSRLSPWEGCWVENRTDHPISLLISAVEADLLTGLVFADPARASLDPSEDVRWARAIHATLDERGTAPAERATVVLALDPAAHAGYDRFDFALPPASPGSRIRLALEPGRVDEGAEPGSGSGQLLRDARGEQEPDLRWNLVTDAEDEFELTWEDPLRAGLPEWTLILQDPVADRRWDMRELRSLRLPAGHHRFSIQGTAMPPAEVPSKLELAVEPNPFRESTVFRFALSHPSRARLIVYGASGDRVWEPQLGGTLVAGEHALVWTGRDHDGVRVPAGTYFIRLWADGIDRTERFVLIR